MDLGNFVELGVKLAAERRDSNDTSRRGGRDVREVEIRRSQQGGIARHGDAANKGQRNWRYAIVDHGGNDNGHFALRLHDGQGSAAKQWNLQADPERPGEYVGRRVGDVPGLGGKAESAAGSLRHPEDAGVWQEGCLQAHRATPDEIYATMQDGKTNGTFRIRRESAEGGDDRWRLKFEGRPAEVQDSLRAFVGGLKKSAAWSPVFADAYQAMRAVRKQVPVFRNSALAAQRGVGGFYDMNHGPLGALHLMPGLEGAGAEAARGMLRHELTHLYQDRAPEALSWMSRGMGRPSSPDSWGGLRELTNEIGARVNEFGGSPVRALLDMWKDAPGYVKYYGQHGPGGCTRAFSAYRAAPAAVAGTALATTTAAAMPYLDPLPAAGSPLPSGSEPTRSITGAPPAFFGVASGQTSAEPPVTPSSATGAADRFEPGSIPSAPSAPSGREALLAAGGLTLAGGGLAAYLRHRRAQKEREAGAAKTAAPFHDPRVGQRAGDGRPPHLELAFFANRSTPQVLRPDLGDEPRPKSGYGDVTLQRRATPEEVTQLNAGQWLRVDEEGRTPKDPDYRVTAYRAGLARLHREALERQKQASAFIRDVELDRLPACVRQDVERFVEGPLKGLKAPQYGMVVKELVKEADPHNLAVARAHFRDEPEGDRGLERRVHQQIRRGEKFVLVINRRVVDGHHFLAKAERAGCTASLPVLDLTGCRHQGEYRKRADYEISHTKTMPDGRKLDVLRLQRLVTRLKQRQVPLDDITGVIRSARSGFSLDRYENTDPSYPLILDGNQHLLDGRHRYFRHQDAGNDLAPAVTATPRMIEQSLVKEATLPGVGLGALFGLSQRLFALSKQAGGPGDRPLSCLMAPVAENDPLFDQLVAFARSLPKDDLYVGDDGKQEGGQYGVELEPHVTVVFGFTDPDPKPIEKFLRDQGPLRIMLDRLSVFEGGEGKPYDVLKFEAKCENLHALNAKLRDRFEVESTLKDYHPHLTVAYLKAGRARKFLSHSALEGSAYTASSLTWSDPKKVHTAIKLEGAKKKEASAASTLDTLSYPLTGPLGSSTAVAAGVGAGTMGLLHAYRKARGFVTGHREPEEHGLVEDLGRGAVLGAAANVGFKGLSTVMGGAQGIPARPVPYEQPALPGVGTGNFVAPTFPASPAVSVG